MNGPEFSFGDPTELKLTEAAAKQLIELQQLVEAGKLSPERVSMNWLMQQVEQRGGPITREDVGDRAIVVNASELGALGALEYIDRNGQPEWVDEDSLSEEQLFILFPWDLGSAKH